MRFNRRGTELSMNVIIIAAIAVLVLVILAMFVFRSADRTDKGTGCTGLGGSCDFTATQKCSGAYPIPGIAFDSSCGTGKKCCLPLGSN